MTRGPCAKRRVECVLTDRWGTHYVGENDCANPQPTCPRLPGEDYTKCKTICQQSGHAEVEAMKKAMIAQADFMNGEATVYGHYWICEPCGRMLLAAGIKKVQIEHG